MTTPPGYKLVPVEPPGECDHVMGCGEGTVKASVPNYWNKCSGTGWRLVNGDDRCNH